MEGIIGHEKQLRYLEHVRLRNTLAHAYLFHGPDGVGKRTVARAYAKTLTGARDIIFLDTSHTLVSKKDERKDIPIEDIRELKRLFSFAPEAGKWRVAIVDEAERMSREAANAFLKFLEEPGEQTLFLLVTSSPELLLPTIASRAYPIRFSLVPERQMDAWLRPRVENAAAREEILSLSLGRPGEMRRFIEDSETLALRRALRRDVERVVVERDVNVLFPLAARAAEKEDERGAFFMEVFHTLRTHALVSQDLASVRRIKAVNRIATILATTNVSPRLALDVALLEALV